MKIFLGGTCNNSNWRSQLIPNLKIDFFNPVVPVWTDEAYHRELQERETCDICLYVITPLAKGYYSIAEVVDDSNKRPEKTIMCLISEEGGKTFDRFQLKSLKKIGAMVQENGATYCEGMDALIQHINKKQSVPTASSFA